MSNTNESFEKLLSDYDSAIDQAIAKAEIQAAYDYVSDMILDCLERTADDCWSLEHGEWVRAELRGKSPAEVRQYWIDRYSEPNVIFDSPEQIEAFRQRIADRLS